MCTTISEYWCQCVYHWSEQELRWIKNGEWFTWYGALVSAYLDDLREGRNKACWSKTKRKKGSKCWQTHQKTFSLTKDMKKDRSVCIKSRHYSDIKSKFPKQLWSFYFQLKKLFLTQPEYFSMCVHFSISLPPLLVPSSQLSFQRNPQQLNPDLFVKYINKNLDFTFFPPSCGSK